jgi:hypothetical protein
MLSDDPDDVFQPPVIDENETLRRRAHFRLCAEQLRSLGLLEHKPTSDGPDPRSYIATTAAYELLSSLGLLKGTHPNPSLIV